jgi:hypothetical protein
MSHGEVDWGTGYTHVVLRMLIMQVLVSQFPSHFLQFPTNGSIPTVRSSADLAA